MTDRRDQPAKRSGRDSDDNLETLCAAHHRAKTNRDLKMIAKARRNKAKHEGTAPETKAKLLSRKFRPTREWR